MGRPKSYRELIAWQKAMALARSAYAATENLPRRESFGLVDQIRRAAVSVPSNIAEGHGRLSDLQFRVFLGNARGSLCEMQTQIELATELAYLKREDGQKLLEQASEVARIMNGLLQSLRKKPRDSGANPANSASTASPAL